MGTKVRFEALDQLRGFAILAMIFAHFGPGVYERLHITGKTLAALELFGRFATPAFVLVFGLTLAIIYVPKEQEAPTRARKMLLNRAGKVLLCSFLIMLPGTIERVYKGASTYDLISSQYSVLTFYAVGMTITALLIGFFAKNAGSRGMVLGSAFVFLGTYLAYEAWPAQEGTLADLPRILFVSGKYGVLVLLGCAWMMMAVGMYIQHCLTNGLAFRRNIAIIGLAVLLVGLSDGRIVGWRDIDDLALNFHAPAQLWYMSIVAGLSLILLAALDKYEATFISPLMAQVGRYPLGIYVAHAFVLPGVEFLRHVFPGIPDAVSITVCLGAFLCYCAYKVMPGLRKSMAPGRRSRSLSAS